MSESAGSPKAVRYLIAMAAFVIVVAGMRAAASLLIPFLLAMFLAVILTPPMRWLENRRIPTSFALLIVVAAMWLAGVGVIYLVGSSVSDLVANVPQHTARLHEQAEWARQKMIDMGLGSFIVGMEVLDEPEKLLEPDSIETPDADTEGDAEADQPAVEIAPADKRRELIASAEPWEQQTPLSFDPESALDVVTFILRGLTGVFSNGLIILVMLIFMLLESSRFPQKLKAAMGDSKISMKNAEAVVQSIRRYMAIKTCTSVLTGILVSVFLTVLGVEYALVWGLIAFLLNYVPNIGSILAAVPAVALALVQAGVGLALWTAGGYVLINCLISYAIEPRFTGQGLGLSTLVVFLSLIFWGWVLGPVGMLLSAPLTMIVKIALEANDDTRWMGMLLSSKAPKES